MKAPWILAATLALANAGPLAAQSAEPQPAEPALNLEAAARDGDFLAAQDWQESMVSGYLDMAVVNRDGEKLGKVYDLVLDRDKRVTGVVLTFGSVLGIGGKPVGVPWSALQIRDGEDGPVAVVDLTEEQLSAAPEFETLAQQRAQAATRTDTGRSAADIDG